MAEADKRKALMESKLAKGEAPMTPKVEDDLDAYEKEWLAKLDSF